MSKLYGLKIGEEKQSNRCGTFTIDSIDSYNEVTITFLKTKTSIKVSVSNVRSGSVGDKNHPTVFGVGCLGYGRFKSRVGRYGPKTKEYQSWENMLARCYYQKTSRYSAYGGIGVTVCNEWLNFQTFAKWHEINYIEGYHLDSDILTQGSAKIYSPENSVFIPQSLNGLFVNNRKNVGKTSGLPEGVSPCKGKSKPYQSAVSLGGVVHNRKTFYTVKEACDYYDKEKTRIVRLYTEKCFSEGSISSLVYNTLKDYTFKR